MKRLLCLLNHGAAAFAVSMVLASAEPAAGPPLPVEDPDTQALLRAMASPDAVTPTASLEQLKVRYEGRHPELVQQLFLFSLEGRGTREGMLPGAVIRAADVSSRDLALGLVPMLDARDGHAAAKVRNWLGQVERQGDDRRIDYSTYAGILSDPKGHDVTPLIRHMVRVDRGAAGKVLEKVYGEQKAAALLSSVVEP